MSVGNKNSGLEGRVKFGSAVGISSATHLNGVVTVNTSAAHGLSTGDRVVIAGATGMTDLNRSFTCIVIDTDTITVVLTTSQTFISGGTVQKCIEITKWDFTKTADVQDVSDSSNAVEGWKASIPSGWKAWSGSFEGFLYAGTLPPAYGSVVTLELVVNAYLKYAGSAILNSEAVNLAVVGNEAVKISYQFQGDMALTKTDTTV